MKESFRAVSLHREAGQALCDVKRFGVENAKAVRAFHESFPEYSVTPLANLDHFAREAGLKSIRVKDESRRFHLNAFKVLGSCYAIGKYIAHTLGMDISELPCARMTSEEIRKRLGEITFVTATDGNHGRGVAWTANRLGQRSVVYLPKGTARERLENIRALGADASITDLNYDATVRLANAHAKKYGWVVVQDTSWEGYRDIPGWIMEGYATMASETVEQLGEEKPTHVFLQAGVGAMAGSVAGFLADYYGDRNRPIITIVEPNGADCLRRTAGANDGRLRFVTGDMDSIMAGLCCGEPCAIAWDVLKDHADHFVSIPDLCAAKGMRILGNPLPGDDRVISGESGAATFGFVAELMTNPEMGWLRDEVQIDGNSRVLCFSTEGDTDRENYRRIVWDGLYPSCQR